MVREHVTRVHMGIAGADSMRVVECAHVCTHMNLRRHSPDSFEYSVSYMQEATQAWDTLLRASLAAKGFDVTFTSRSRDKGEAAIKSLQAQNPSAKFELRIMDLSDLDTVKDLSKSMLDEGKSIDVLVNNAGVMACPEMQTKQGFEYQLGTNHLGHFALTAGLWPLIMQSGEVRSRRIDIVHTGILARHC